MLNIPDALSLRSALSGIFSLSLTASIISDRRGTNMKESAYPISATPPITILLDSYKPSNSEGPMSIKAKKATINANYVRYSFLIFLLMTPTNGQLTAYTNVLMAKIRPI